MALPFNDSLAGAAGALANPPYTQQNYGTPGVTVNLDGAGGAVVSSSGEEAAAFVNSETFNNDQQSAITIGGAANLSSGFHMGPTVRASGTTSTTFNHYVFSTDGADGATHSYIGKRINGVLTELAPITLAPLADGDELKIQVEGTTIRALKNGVQVGSVSDSSLASGAAGMFTGYGASSGAFIASFSADNFASAPIEQEGFRFRNDDGSESAATWKAAQDTNVTHALSTNLRLRMLLNATGDPASFPFRLDYKKSTDSVYVPVLLAQPSLNPSELTAGSSTSNVLTYATASVTLKAGATYIIGIAHTDAASEQDLASVQTTGGAVAFSQVGSVPFNTIASNVSRLEVWKAIPTADVTDTITITLNDAGTGCTWILREYIDADVTLGTPATNNANAATSISATPGALAATTSHQVAFAAHDLNSTADTASGTGWSSAGTGQTYNTPATGLECAVNTSGAASQVTFSGAGSADRAVIALEIKQKPSQPILMSASANIAASGAATTAQLTAPSGKSTSDFVAGRIQDDENPADAVDITTDDYTELEWCLTAASGIAVNGDIYQFQVSKNGVALDTYTLTPEWTIGTPGPNGSAAMSVAQPAIAASGLVKMVGTAALAVAVAMSGTGTNQQQVTGPGALAVSAPTISAAGTVSAAGAISGSGSLAVAQPAIAGSGTNQQQVAGTGALSVTQPAFSASGTNQQQVTGSGSLAVPIPEWKFGDRIEVPVPSISGTGTVANGVSGSGVLAVQPTISASGTNQQQVTGSAALAVAKPSIAASGGQGSFNAGTAAMSVGGPAIAAAGTNQQQVTGSATLAVAKPSISSAGQQRNTGAASLAVQAPTISGAGSNTPPAVTGSGSLAVPVPSMAGIQSTITIIGPITLVSPRCVISVPPARCVVTTPAPRVTFTEPAPRVIISTIEPE